MENRQSVILGYDIISPLGTDRAAQWEALNCGKSGIGPLTRFAAGANFPVRVAGQVPEFDAGPYPFLKPREMANWKSPIFRHALLVVHRALVQSGIEITEKLAPRVAVTFSSAVGGQDAVLTADRRMRETGKMPHPFTNPNSCINMVTGKVAMLTGATGPNFSTITACATGATSMINGAMLLAAGRADVAICGAVDFALVEPIVAGFATMNGAYRHKPGREEAPEAASRPFAAGRRGFVVSEGAGAVILATREFAETHGLDWRIGLRGWSMTGDAHHFVAPYEPTVRRCIAESIADAGISPQDIDAVNAHAASTQAGDRVEHDALRAVFGKKLPPTTANKSMTGHAMGASSAIESVFAMEGMKAGVLVPTINYVPDPEMPMEEIVTEPQALDQGFVLKNAFGFGGCNACIVFKQRT
ncbi:MAG: beta-ketoacyl-[acyl-carrier-protein] synthase family protein [Desulfobacteraceae bacterium]|nr:beta-ketoacyl-[acyl-carrier-protein] synthase family protein [Desulfobacteraceae bacterium]